MEEIKVGDNVIYHGSLEIQRGIYPYYVVLELFDFNGVPCAKLGPTTRDFWVERCRVSSISKQSPTACSHAGHDVQFRTGAQDRCNTCGVDYN